MGDWPDDPENFPIGKYQYRQHWPPGAFAFTAAVILNRIGTLLIEINREISIVPAVVVTAETGRPISSKSPIRLDQRWVAQALLSYPEVPST